MASQDWFDKDFYKVLGVSKDISEADLKKTYRKLARQYHPDSNPGDAKAEAKFKEISEANSVLSDPETRREYDQIRAMGSGARFTAPGRPGQAGGFEDVFGGMFGQPSPRRSGSQGASFEDLLGGMFGGGDTGFGSSTGGFRGAGVVATSQRRRPSTSSPPSGARRSSCSPRAERRSTSRCPRA
jgi:molecular chaperone DnaJ